MDELWEIEEAGWRSLAGGDPVAHYDAVLADDAVMIVPGMVLDRPAVLRSWQGVEPWQAFELTDRSTRQLGRGVVALTYGASARRRGDDEPYRAVMTSVYAHRNGAWRLALHQQTPQPTTT